jgi:hypothetical protein
MATVAQARAKVCERCHIDFLFLSARAGGNGGIGDKRRVFVKLNDAKRQPANSVVSQWRMINRTLAALAFAVGFDVLLCDGRYTLAVERVALSIARHF